MKMLEACMCSNGWENELVRPQRVLAAVLVKLLRPLRTSLAPARLLQSPLHMSSKS